MTIQNAKTYSTVAGQTSDAPRSAPMSTACTPSGIVASAPTRIAGAAIASTAASVVYSVASQAGARLSATATTTR